MAGVKTEDAGNVAPDPGSAPGQLCPAGQVTAPHGASVPSPVKREAGPDSWVHVQPRASCGGRPGFRLSLSLRSLTCDMQTGTPWEQETPQQI